MGAPGRQRMVPFGSTFVKAFTTPDPPVKTLGQTVSAINASFSAFGQALATVGPPVPTLGSVGTAKMGEAKIPARSRLSKPPAQHPTHAGFPKIAPGGE